MYRMIWHQVFSNYGNLKFAPNDRTEKIRIKQNLSGSGLRVEFSNQYDVEDMAVISARVSLEPKMVNAIPFTLNHQDSFIVPAGQSLWSDVVAIEVPEKASLYLELEIENDANNLATSAHTFSDKIFQTNIDDFGTNYVYGITSVALETAQTGTTIGFFGDSLTNQGYYADAATEWLYENVPGISAINEGISGNRLLLPGTSESEWNASFGRPAVERFSHLMKYRPDVAAVLIGDNDLYQVGATNANEMPTSSEMITALKRIQNQASVSGVLPILVTLTPFNGAMSGESNAWRAEKEAIRTEVNQWIRQRKMMIDLDQFVRDGIDQTKLAQKFDSGDHLHFSRSGGKEIGEFMAAAIMKLVKGE